MAGMLLVAAFPSYIIFILLRFHVASARHTQMLRLATETSAPANAVGVEGIVIVLCNQTNQLHLSSSPQILFCQFRLLRIALSKSQARISRDYARLEIGP